MGCNGLQAGIVFVGASGISMFTYVFLRSWASIALSESRSSRKDQGYALGWGLVYLALCGVAFTLFGMSTPTCGG